MTTSRTGIQSEKNFRLPDRWARFRDNRPAVSGLHPTAHERHGREQRSAIALKLLFCYLNCRPSNIVVKYSTEGVAILYWELKGGGAIVENIPLRNLKIK